MSIHIQCKNDRCRRFEIIGPGHPAVRFNPETQQHEFFDRTAVIDHHPSCSGDGSDPLHFTFMAGTVTMVGGIPPVLGGII